MVTACVGGTAAPSASPSSGGASATPKLGGTLVFGTSQETTHCDYTTLVVIGGLIRDEDLKTVEKIPVLGDLPLVGQLFRHTFRDHRRSEVMIFLTIKMTE